jgi:hypothetical protein
VDKGDKMNNVIDISKYKPHKVSKVICLRCFKRWIAVRPVDILLEDLECSECGKGFIIETGEEIEYEN